MDYSKLVNIKNIDYEKEIKDIIKKVKDEYDGLTTDMTCKIYSSIIHSKLREKHVNSRIINTKDLGFAYEHQFVIASNLQEKYLIDLTYSQFFSELPLEFKNLDTNGYIKYDDNILKEYLKNINSIKKIDNIYKKN